VAQPQLSSNVIRAITCQSRRLGHGLAVQLASFDTDARFSTLFRC